MSHFAELDEDNKVIRVLVCNNDYPNEGYDWLLETFGGRWVQTSYNAKFRKNFAGEGYYYDEEIDAFIPPQPFGSWLFNAVACNWYAPTPYPQDGRQYLWDEELVNWKEVNNV